MVGGWKPATPLLWRYLHFVVNSPELCRDLRSEEWSLCMLKLEGLPPHCEMNVPKTPGLCCFIDFTSNHFEKKEKKKIRKICANFMCKIMCL